MYRSAPTPQRHRMIAFAVQQLLRASGARYDPMTRHWKAPFDESDSIVLRSPTA